MTLTVATSASEPRPMALALKNAPLKVPEFVVFPVALPKGSPPATASSSNSVSSTGSLRDVFHYLTPVSGYEQFCFGNSSSGSSQTHLTDELSF